MRGRAATLLAVPMDRRLPKVRVSTSQGVSLMGQRLVIEIDSWAVSSQYPSGHVVNSLGPIGTRVAETAALLVENELEQHLKPFSSEAIAELPPNGDSWSADEDMAVVAAAAAAAAAVAAAAAAIAVEEEEMGEDGSGDGRRRGMDAYAPLLPPLAASPPPAPRRDLRKLNIFSIDPAGCEDIDDAMSVRTLPNGTIELGVHIADVTHFVRHQGVLDREARFRATSVYVEESLY